MAEVYKKTLIHEWNFLGEERTEDERLTDTVSGVKVKLGYNASLQPEGIYLSYGDANYMKAYALMENVVGRGCLLVNCSPSSRQLKKYKFFLPAEIYLLAVFMQLASKFHVFPLVLKFQDSF
ncbi:MAG: hypothetical protein MSS14_10885, partial [Mediterraneibacter faecis]